MKKIILSSLVLLFIFCAGFLTNSYSAQSDYYLKLDGIPGDATISGESGWIALYTVQYRESDFEFASSLTPETDQLSLINNPIWTITKPVDKSSPLFFDALATGKHIKEGIIAICSDDICESKILLSDVSITGFNINSTNVSGPETIVIQSISSNVKQGPEDTVIPGWIKNNAKWFADGSIGQSDFTKGIEYMIQNGIMKIPNLPPSASGGTETTVPDWIKNNAKWWSEGQITDDDFVKGIQYLVEKGIIKV